MQIFAKKIISDDKVEIKFSMVYDIGNGQSGTNYIIQPIQKLGKWTPLKSNGDYTTNWDNSGNIVIFAAK